MARITPYIVEQTDRALETAIGFIQARRVGEIAYGRNGRSAGCVVTHFSFRERWLKVKWSPAGEVIPFLWDGDLLSIGLDGVSKPRIFGYFDWEAIGVHYRAIMMSVARGSISKQPYPESLPVLEPTWWDQLSNAIATIQAKQTDRIHVTDEGMERRLREHFGLKLRLPFPLRQTGHGDLHWANVTAPEFSIIDWATWGRAPYGFDVAHLHVVSATEPMLVAKLREVFSPVIARPEYDVAFLVAASEALRHYPKLESDLRREVDRVLEERRFAGFCES